ncbi:fibrinogen-like protein A [Mytilus californianus]|uniref:fibrinogen-like protein A n=1 Tax=Mytilus californianus TaxID=6549 RepID=UPI002247C1EC|nr:fibrinogen-like protein A [Mytilus californianus]
MNPDRMNTRLTGYKIRTFDNIPPRICFDKCIRRPRCHSYNYNRHILRCELNYKPKPGFVEHFHNEVGFVYVDVDHYRGDPMYDTCLGNPCKSGEVCETKKDRSVFCVKDQENMPVGDCTELFEYRRKSGIYTIYPSKADEGVKVFCNMTNGGWTVIQRRIDGEENFHRNWVEYENGFGELQHEFWLGNKYLHLLTTSGKYKLRVELVHNNGTNVFAEYQNFLVEDAASKYRIVVNGYSGYAGYYMHANNDRRYFSTYDSDNDAYEGSCMNDYGYGAWWIGHCNGYPDLNNKNITIVRWDSGYNIKSISDMMIQRK